MSGLLHFKGLLEATVSFNKRLPGHLIMLTTHDPLKYNTGTAGQTKNTSTIFGTMASIIPGLGTAIYSSVESGNLTAQGLKSTK